MKKILSVFLVICMVSCLFCGIDVFADTNPEFVFNKVSGSEVYLTGYNGDDEIVEIPSEYEGIPVTTISYRAFAHQLGMKKVIIPDSVKEIGEYAFQDCPALEEVIFSDNLQRIGNRAFFDCKKLKTVNLPSKIIEIDEYALGYFEDFKSGEIFSIDLKINGYTNSAAEEYARDNSFTFVSVGVAPLYLYEVEETYGDEQPRARITKYLGAQKNVVIPSEIDGYLIVGIWRDAFRANHYIENVTIPSSIYFIDEAFAYCSMLKTVTLKSDWISIGDKAFYHCEQLSDFIFEPDYPYFDPAKDHISISLGEKAIEGTAYYNNKNNFKNGALYLGSALVKVESTVKSFTIPDYVTCIGAHAFKDCTKLTSITIPVRVEEISHGAFEGCTALNNVIFNKDSHCYIENNAFLNCPSLKEIRVPKNVMLSMYSAGYSFEYVESLGHTDYVKQEDFKVYGETGGEGNAKWFANRSDFEFIEYDFSSHTHSYKNSCDTTCNTCGEVRKVTHKYTKYTTVKATLTKNGYILRECAVCGKDYDKTINYMPKTFKLSAIKYTYNGKMKTPTLKVYDSKGKLIGAKNYTAKYATGRKNVGKYKVTVTFKGNYSGTKNLYFTINPANTTVNSLTAGKKSLKVAITKKSSQVTGYQIQYATNKSFKSAKLKNVTNYKTTSVTLSKLSAKKTYYVRVRTYKKIGKTTFYSGWSAAKYKKTK